MVDYSPLESSPCVHISQQKSKPAASFWSLPEQMASSNLLHAYNASLQAYQMSVWHALYCTGVGIHSLLNHTVLGLTSFWSGNSCLK